MNQNRNETAQEFMEEIVDDLGYTPKGGKNQRSGSSTGQSRASTYLILVGVVLFVAVAAFFLMGRNGNPTEELASIQARLNRLEERMVGLNRLDERMVGLNKLDERMTRLEGLKGLKGLAGLEDRINRLEKDAKDLQQEIQKTASRNVAPPSKKAALEVKQEVKQQYHTVRPGESLYMITRKYGISMEKLCQLNKITPKKSIQPGQKLLVRQ